MPEEDLAKWLQEAKKKPRNFAIIAKGANVLQVIVDKRPIKDGALMKAKKEFQGNAVVKGVVVGDGPELTFQVQEETSLSDVKLKKFIVDATGLNLKPRFQVVTDLQEVDDDSLDEGGEGEPAQSEEPPPVPETPAPPGEKLPSADQLMAALNKLSPAIKQAVADNPTRKEEILRPVAGFQALVKAGELPKAKEALLQIGALLKTLQTTPETPPPPEDPAQKEWESRWPAVEQACLKALAGKPPEANKLQTVRDYAADQAGAGQYAKAVAALNRLQPLIDAVLAGQDQGGKKPSGLVAYRRALLEFAMAKSTVAGQIAALQRAIPSEMPDEQDLAEELAAELEELNETLGDAVDEAINASKSDTAPLTDAVRKQILRYLSELSANALIKHVDSNPFSVPMTIEKTLSAALSKIRDSMPA
jgi:hypothetical protein